MLLNYRILPHRNNFEDDFSAKTEVNEGMKTNMAASYFKTRES